MNNYILILLQIIGVMILCAMTYDLGYNKGRKDEKEFDEFKKW